MSREITSKVLEMIEAGSLDQDRVIIACFKYMSESDVADMARINGFLDACEDCGELADTQLHSVSEIESYMLCKKCIEKIEEEEIEK